MYLPFEKMVKLLEIQWQDEKQMTYEINVQKIGHKGLIEGVKQNE